jgi:class 3 adenylate cyclase
MADNTSRTLVCSVLFLDIVGYSKHSVAEQHRVKQAFNDTLAKALETTAQRDRIILDTGDGAAITFFGDPENVLKVAIAIRDGATMPVRMGINLGPVRMVTDLNGHTNVIGDGINVAQRVMSFSEPGQLLVSRSFYEIASSLTDEHARLFKHVGARKDKHVRAHEVYSVGGGALPAGRARGAGARGDELAQIPAEVFDAGEHLVVSAHAKARVQEELERLTRLGSRLMSEITEVGNKWVATVTRPPDVPTLSRVEQLGYMRIVTGPTREVVAGKVKKLVGTGAAIVADVECINGVWTAVCEERPQD